MVYHCKTKPQVLRKTEDLREETWLFSQTFCLSPRWGASISVAPSRKWESGFILNIAVLTFAGFKNRITGIERTSRDFFSDIPLFHSGPSWTLHPVYPVCPDAEEDTSHGLVEWARLSRWGNGSQPGAFGLSLCFYLSRPICELIN